MAEVLHPVRYRLLIVDDVDDDVAESAGASRVDDERERLSRHGTVGV